MDLSKKVASCGLFLSFALILGYVEGLFPLPTGIPGIKLGLPNLAILLMLYLFGWKEALIIDILRIFLSGFLFGSMFSILYSLSGGLLSFFVMLLLKTTGKFSISGVSISGGFSHNMGQLIVAYFVLGGFGIFYYLPLLAIGGVITGTLIGIVCTLMLPALKKVTG